MCLGFRTLLALTLLYNGAPVEATPIAPVELDGVEMLRLASVSHMQTLNLQQVTASASCTPRAHSNPLNKRRCWNLFQIR